MGFNPSDASTFITDRRTGRRWSIPHWPIARTVFAGILFVIMILFNMVAQVNLTWCGSYSHEVYENLNLRRVILCWQTKANAPTDAIVIDPSYAVNCSGRSVSPFSHQRRYGAQVWCHRMGRRWGISAVGNVILLAAMLLLYASRPGVIRTVTGLLLTMLVASIVAFYAIDDWSRVRPSADYAYLTDYVFVNGVDFSADASQQARLIVAFSRKHCVDGRQRVVGFLDGHVESMSDDRLRMAAEAQGLEGIVDMYQDADDLPIVR